MHYDDLESSEEVIEEDEGSLEVMTYTKEIVLKLSLRQPIQYCETDTDKAREWLQSTCTTTRGTCTGLETMVYGSYRSWNNGDLLIITKSDSSSTSSVYDPCGCGSHGSHGS